MKCEIKPLFFIGKCRYEDDKENKLLCYEAHLFHSIIDALQRVPIMGRAVGDFHCPYFGITQSEQQKNRKDGSDATQPEKR